MKQMHHNESRGYPRAEEEEESTCSVLVAVLSGLRSWKLQDQDVELLGL